MSELLLVTDDAVSSVIGRYLTMWIDGRLYGISVASVHETIGAVDSACDGVINLRGQMVPVTDLRTPEGRDGLGSKAGPLVVLTGRYGRQAAVMVDALNGVMDVSVDEFHAPRDEMRRADTWVSAVVECTIGTVWLLDGRAIVADSQLADLTATAAETLV